MRKPMILLAVMLVAAIAAPALARTVKGSFTAQLAPFPNAGDTDRPGCLAGVEGVHYVSRAFKAPDKGVLKVSLMKFEGDWDLFVTNKAGTPLAASDSSQLQGAPPEEEIIYRLAKGAKVNIEVCNWAGGPSAKASYVYRYQ